MVVALSSFGIGKITSKKKKGVKSDFLKTLNIIIQKLINNFIWMKGDT